MTPFYFPLLSEFLPLIAGLFFGSLVIGILVRYSGLAGSKRLGLLFPWTALIVSILAGLWLAWQAKAIFDDAYITFRYANNFLQGNGIVWNVGERVEGYTNFLWLIIVSAVTWVTGARLPIVGLFGCLVFFVINLVTIFAIGKKLSAQNKGQAYFPVAVIWLAVHHVFYRFGTSGLETMFGSWLVNMAIWFMVTRKDLKGTFLSALFLILSTMTRPDHALFYITMAMVLTAEYAVGYVKAIFNGNDKKIILKRAFKEAAAFSAPFLLYLGYLAWKYYYYGDIVPNTFYAKSASDSYWSQGYIYFKVYGLKAHMLVIIPIFIGWLAIGKVEATKRLKRFFGLSVLIYSMYVFKIGGDFMYGRFFLVLLPMVLLGIEHLIHQLARKSVRRPAWAAIIISAVVIATCHGLVFEEFKQWKKLKANMGDQNRFFKLTSLNPIKISSGNNPKRDRTAMSRPLKNYLADNGIKPVISRRGIGILAFYSELPFIDALGLTDRWIGQKELHNRGKPGHEKLGTISYYDYRNLRILWGGMPGRGTLHRPYAMIKYEGNKKKKVGFYRYETELVEKMRKVLPGFRFEPFPEYIDDHLEEMAFGNIQKVAKKTVDMDHYYFALNYDPDRRAMFTDRFIRFEDFENGDFPIGTEFTGDFNREIVYPAYDGHWLLEYYQGEGIVMSGRHKTAMGKALLPPFTIQGDTILFKVAGAADMKRLWVGLYIDGERVFKSTGSGTNKFSWIQWNVKRHIGKEAQLVLCDHSISDTLYFDFFIEGNKKEQ